jgi:ABC-type multidrug transport system ATPase subunit
VEITARNLDIGYDSPLAQNLDFRVGPGITLGLIGANGSGKTTLLRTLLGLTPALKGDISLSPSLLQMQRNSEIGVVWQDAGLPFNISPSRWIQQLAKIHKQPVDEALLKLIESPVHNRTIRSLSGGEKQRLAIYSALFFQPKFLVLDEPTVGLDESSREIFYELMQKHQNRGGAAIITSHYAVDIAVVTNQILNLSDQTPLETGAIFNTSKAISAELLERFNITRVTNGYQIKSEKPWDIATEIAIAANVEITYYRMVKNA